MPRTADSERKGFWTFWTFIGVYLGVMILGSPLGAGWGIHNRMQPSKFRKMTGCPNWDFGFFNFWRFIITGTIQNKDGSSCPYGSEVGQAYGIRAQFIFGAIVATIALLGFSWFLARQVSRGDIGGAKDVAGIVATMFMLAFVGSFVLAALAMYLIFIAVLYMIMTVVLMGITST